MTNRIWQMLSKSPWRVVGLICFMAGAYAGVLRFTKGLGGSTNLNDDFPWGIWVGFDVITGVGLAAGGFTISALVYILRLEKYRPLARPAVMTAFIGYLLVVGGLIFDLGHPWRIWHPLIMWNPHSVMFEVAWCVTSYTLVLAAEASVLFFQRFGWKRITRIAERATFSLTLLAVLLSMLHQSSLGSFFLIVPGRLHEFWYSPLLPFLFFMSAVSIGLVMTIIESNLSARAFGTVPESDLLRKIARMASAVMVVYLIVRLSDLTRVGPILKLWAFDRASLLFFLEIGLGFVIPIILFNSKRVLYNNRLLYRAAQIALLGFIINRLNVTITGFEVISGKTYIVAWSELAITLMIITLGVTAFHFAARYLPLFEKDESAAERQRSWELEFGRQRAADFLTDNLMQAALEGKRDRG